MLVELAIRNFAIIEHVRIEFAPGLNVLTGETGAGKSILIDALGAVLGDRVSTDMVRTGARSASIDATFDLQGFPHRHAIFAILEDLLIDQDDHLLILSREIHGVGRSTARLNGRPTTISILGEVGSLLVDIHGQSDHLSLLKPSAQLDLLDRFAQSVPGRTAFAARLGELRAMRQTLQRSLSGARDRMQRIDLLRYQIDEIIKADLQPAEEDQLVTDRDRLMNAERLALHAASAYATLAGEDENDRPDSVVPRLRLAAQVIAELGAIDPSAASMAERVHELLFLLEDLANDVRGYRDSVEFNPRRLEVVEERLAELRQLKKKYGAEIADILQHANSAQEELDRLTGSDSDAEVLATREAELAQETGELAQHLSRTRTAMATELSSRVMLTIAQLNMGAAEFAISIEQTRDSGGIPVTAGNGIVETFAADTTGIDRVVFLIAPNAGEALKPLSRIASGGETARLMLALKSVLSAVDQTPTLVFDEIDVGVGGRSAQVVGETLWGLTDQHQVIVITHLPQIAAFADRHFQIAKSDQDGRVISTIVELEPRLRIEELAVMLDGVPVSDGSLANASDMVERAAAVRRAGGRAAE